MLPKKNRANTKNIEHIFKVGRFVSSPNLTFKFIFDTKSMNKRISFIAPKTATKSAVKRNLLRRRGYIALAKHFDRFPAGIVGAFVCGKKSLELFGLPRSKKNNGMAISLSNLETEMEVILSKIR